MSARQTRSCAQHGDTLLLLESVFSDCFKVSHNTVLIGGAAEPLYQPSQFSGDVHRLFYREDYFSSALHEVAHWCIAGAKRRQQVDFGYWYAPDGRSKQQQQAFEAVEFRPQALEWFFSRACRHPFRVSIDNLDGNDGLDSIVFRQNIYDQAARWRDSGLPTRGAVYYTALGKAFGQRSAASDLELLASEVGL